MRRFLILAGLASLACGPVPDEPSEGGTSTGSQPSGFPAKPTSNQSSTSGIAPTATSDVDDSEDGTFLVVPDGGPACGANIPDGTIAHCYPCSPWQQDCAEGDRCTPYGSDGGAWNATRCSEIVRDPGAIGEPCVVEGGPFTGLDDCDIGAMCFHVDPETNEGTCVAMCQGSPNDPICDPGTTCTIRNEGVLTLCMPTCNPLLDDCDDGHVCGSDDSISGVEDTDFWCVPQVKPVPLGESCEFVGQCTAGSACIDGELAGCRRASCCSAFCDLADPDPNALCADGQVCIDWYEPDQGPPELRSLGICAAP